MNLSDYLINQKAHHWASILTDWAWLLPHDLTVWMVNRFGDLILVLESGTVQLLDIGRRLCQATRQESRGLP